MQRKRQSNCIYFHLMCLQDPSFQSWNIQSKIFKLVLKESEYDNIKFKIPENRPLKSWLSNTVEDINKQNVQWVVLMK